MRTIDVVYSEWAWWQSALLYGVLMLTFIALMWLMPSKK